MRTLTTALSGGCASRISSVGVPASGYSNQPSAASSFVPSSAGQCRLVQIVVRVADVGADLPKQLHDVFLGHPSVDVRHVVESLSVL